MLTMSFAQLVESSIFDRLLSVVSGKLLTEASASYKFPANQFHVARTIPVEGPD